MTLKINYEQMYKEENQLYHFGDNIPSTQWFASEQGSVLDASHLVILGMKQFTIKIHKGYYVPYEVYKKNIANIQASITNCRESIKEASDFQRSDCIFILGESGTIEDLQKNVSAMELGIKVLEKFEEKVSEVEQQRQVCNRCLIAVNAIMLFLLIAS